jgi:predicted RNA-binding protein YlxR (DUF448 family)
MPIEQQPPVDASPVRRCIVTREALARDRGLRFVLDPEGRVRPDVEARLPGRGMWLSADRNVLNKAITKNLFARAARATVRVDADLPCQVERLLVRRALDRLGLARRAGQVAMGFEQVREALRTAPVAVLLSAADGAADGREKLRRLAPTLPLIAGFSRVELGSALGRDSLVHVAVAPGPLARRLLRDAERLAGFRQQAVVWPAGADPQMSDELQESTGAT